MLSPAFELFLSFPTVRDRVRTKIERDILADVNHPFVVKLHYGECRAGWDRCACHGPQQVLGTRSGRACVSPCPSVAVLCWSLYNPLKTNPCLEGSLVLCSPLNGAPGEEV